MEITWILLAATTVVSVNVGKDQLYMAATQANLEMLPTIAALGQSPNPALSGPSMKLSPSFSSYFITDLMFRRCTGNRGGALLLWSRLV